MLHSEGGRALAPRLRTQHCTRKADGGWVAGCSLAQGTSPWEKGVRPRALSSLRARAPPESHCMLRRMRWPQRPPVPSSRPTAAADAPAQTTDKRKQKQGEMATPKGSGRAVTHRKSTGDQSARRWRARRAAFLLGAVCVSWYTYSDRSRS